MLKKHFIERYHQFILMLTFLTRIPIRYSFSFEPSSFGKGYVFFPIIGGIIGVLLCLPVLMRQSLPSSSLAFLIIIWYLLLVGGIHLDGVADVFDGVFSARERTKILMIMEDSHIGAFGAIGLILYFLGLYVGIEQVISSSLGVWIILIMPIVSRSISVFIIGFCRYAKPTGLGKGIVDCIRPIPGTIILMIVFSCVYFVSPLILLTALMTTLILSFIVYRIHRLLNGITGDVIGAMVEIGQVVYLLLAGILFNSGWFNV